jgi:hypothetical protein
MESKYSIRDEKKKIVLYAKSSTFGFENCIFSSNINEFSIYSTDGNRKLGAITKILKESNESKLNKTLLSISFNSDLNVVNKSRQHINSSHVSH